MAIFGNPVCLAQMIDLILTTRRGILSLVAVVDTMPMLPVLSGTCILLVLYYELSRKSIPDTFGNT